MGLAAVTSALRPPPRRQSIAPPALALSWRRNLRDALGGGPPGEPPGWQRIVEYRQRVTLVLAAAATAAMLWLSDLLLRAQQMPDATRRLYLLVYAAMTFFLASNAFKMLLGAWHMLHDGARNPWHPARTSREPEPATKVAIVFPVYHEAVARVAAGMAATWESIERAHPAHARHFDCFLLSDSRRPDYRIVEEAAVHRLREAFPNGRFRYRWRPCNRNAKLGNIADFCRRWGRAYDHMLVMDADSVMDGDAIVALLRMMAGNPRLGILQTNPKPILRTSLFGRMQQFAARLYGSVFSWGLQAMYMGNASYIGHNAMVRLRPFVRHCMLPELSGPKPWGGKPLSHDIVESALMARAGYEVWFLNEIEGSYEEVPANIVGFLARERRWMQGNLQHLRFLALRGIRAIHRETFLTGSLGYVAAPLWAVFLVVSAYGMIHFLQHGVLVLGSLRAIELPVTMLLASSMVFLFLPRLLAVAVHIARDRARLFGGKDKLVWSMLLETLFSFFFSPLMMIYTTRFLWLWARRRGIDWGAQPRGDDPLTWAACWHGFGWVSAVGLAATAALTWQIAQVPWTQEVLIAAMSGGLVRPSDLMLWFSPILGGFTLSVWIARATSRSWPAIARRRLFTIPEEVETPPVVARTIAWEAWFRAHVPDPSSHVDVVEVLLADHWFRDRYRDELPYRPAISRAFRARIDAGEQLSEGEKMRALGDRECFDALHIAATARLIRDSWNDKAGQAHASRPRNGQPC